MPLCRSEAPLENPIKSFAFRHILTFWRRLIWQVGVNFGAGMTGGFAYVLDEADDLEIRLNSESIELLPITDLTIHQEHLRGIINQHFDETGSARAQDILGNFDAYAPKFKLVKPTATDVKTLLGHRSRSSAELRVQAQ